MSRLIQLASIRRNFGNKIVDFSQLPAQPCKLFERWLADAIEKNIDDANACVLATVDAEGIPDARIVLLKEIANNTLVFYTNYSSQKSIQINHNPYVALNFYWPSLCRQIRVRGSVEKIEAMKSAAYFHERPRESQIATYASKQSTATTRETLEESFEKYTKLFLEKETIEYPVFWGGYQVSPIVFEFWQGREHRLHDRAQYTYKDNIWEKKILAP